MYTNTSTYTLGAGLHACLPPSGPKMCIPSSADPSWEMWVLQLCLMTPSLMISLWGQKLSHIQCVPSSYPPLLLYAVSFFFFKSAHDMTLTDHLFQIPAHFVIMFLFFKRKYLETSTEWLTIIFFISPLSRLLSCDSWEKVNKAFDKLRSSCWSMHSHYLLSLLLLISCFLTFMLYL